MKGGRRSLLRGPIFHGFMKMKLGICLLLICEIPGGEMLTVKIRVEEVVFESCMHHKIGYTACLNSHSSVHMLE